MSIQKLSWCGIFLVALVWGGLQGAIFTAIDNGDTAWIAACQPTDLAAVTSDYMQHTPMTYAVYNMVYGGNAAITIAVISALMDKGADIKKSNAGGQTPILLAIDARNLALVKALMSAGITPLDIAIGTLTVLDRAKQRGDPDILAYLATVPLPAPKNIFEAIDRGDTAWIAACQPTDLAAVTSDSIQHTPMTYAVYNMVYGGNAAITIAVINALIAKGADIRKKNGAAQTPILLAIDAKNLDLVKALMGAGITTLDIAVGTETVLDRAKQGGNPDILAYVEKHAPKQPSPKQPSPKQPSPKQPSPKQPSPKQPSPKQPSPKQPSPKQPSSKQPSSKQSQPGKQLPAHKKNSK